MEDPSWEDIYNVGTLAKIIKMIVLPDGKYHHHHSREKTLFKSEKEIKLTTHIFSPNVKVPGGDFSQHSEKNRGRWNQSLKRRPPSKYYN